MKEKVVKKIKDWLFKSDEQGISRLDAITSAIVIVSGFIITALLIRGVK